MISLRSHAISLAAVFLALAIGVALGSGLLSNTLLAGLKDDKTQMQNQINGLTDEKNALNEKLSAAGEFDAQMSPRILRDALKGKSVIVFRTPDAADDDVEATSRLVGDAGGVVTGTIDLTQEFVDANSSEKLLSVVNSPIVPAGRQLSTTSVDQGSQAGDLLGIAMLTGKDPAAPAVDDTQRDARAGSAARHRLHHLRRRTHRRGRFRADRDRRRVGRRCGQSGCDRGPLRRGLGAARCRNTGRGTRWVGQRHGCRRGDQGRQQPRRRGGNGRRRRQPIGSHHVGAGTTGNGQRRSSGPVRHRSRCDVGHHRSVASAPALLPSRPARQSRLVGLGVRVSFRGSAGPKPFATEVSPCHLYAGTRRPRRSISSSVVVWPPLWARGSPPVASVSSSPRVA